MVLAPPLLASLQKFSGTAVFLGGTAGIGRELAVQIARHTQKPCQIVIVGRNEDAASATFELMRQSQQAEHKFVFEKCDATVMANVRRTSERLTSSLDKLNLLVMTCGFLTTRGRTENNTDECIDTKMAVNYYARMLMTRQLLPLLQKAQREDGQARVLSVLDSVMAPGKLDYTDLDLRTTFGLSKCAKHTTTMTNVTFEDLALQYPALAFSHAYPGFVSTDIGRDFNIFMRTAFKAVALVAATSVETCSHFLLKPCFEDRYSKGDWRVDNKGEPVTKPSPETGEEARQKVKAHLDEVFGRGIVRE